MKTKTYFVKTFGNEDNCFAPAICSYDYSQYKEVIEMLKVNNIPYKAWVE